MSDASPRRTLTFVRRNALLALCMLGVLSATCNLGLPTTVDCPWTIIGPGYGNIPGQIPVGKEVLLQVFRDAGAPGLPDNLGCKPIGGAINTDVVRWVSSDPAVATLRNATYAELGTSFFLGAFLKGASPGITTVVAFVTPFIGAKEVESRPLPVTVIP